MNITDIDDKIIKRARQNYLFEKYAAKEQPLEKVLSDAKKVIRAYNVYKITAKNYFFLLFKNKISKHFKNVLKLLGNGQFFEYSKGNNRS